MLIQIANNESVVLHPQNSQDELLIGAILAVVVKGGLLVSSPNEMRRLTYKSNPGSVTIESEIEKQLARYISPFERD